ncbi:DsbA family oxidoreductase, partial [Dermacoccus nishinomiyaensis]|uniref:DsbA family oxidoreductase n=4 Tax=Dermacoccaceae TaxID=145357 RepID=UPI0028A0DBB4
MKIDIWSDIVCPFCYIGKRHLELALDGFEHADDVEIAWHSFELDPTIEAVPDTTLVEKIAAKYGMTPEQSERSQEDIAARAAEVGLEFNWREAKFGNTFDAHRLVHLAAQHGRATEAHERLMRAYFTEGVAVGDTTELQRLGEEIGLPADDVRRV